jgi:serine/threonine-protein kinase
MKLCPTCRREFVDSQQACPIDDARLGSVAGSPPPGLGRVLGTYRLVGFLGEGGMGSIYIGAHTRLDRYVAIKVLRPELANNKLNVARFFDEARTVQRIKHPHIVDSIDMVEDGVEGVYCVLELLRGPNLSTQLAAGALPIDAAIRIAVQIADALSAVHALGIVHRDLKPDNLILIQRDGFDEFVKLIDFGVAQTGSVTSAEGPVGTAAYMAPEQAATANVDARADIYALGVLLFEMVTGEHPFPSTTDHEYLLRHAHDEPPKPSKVANTEIPPALEAVIARCLEKQPDDRFASAWEVAIALRGVEGAERGRTRRWAWAATGAVLMTGAAVAALVLSDYFAGTGAAQAQPAAPVTAKAPVAPRPPAPPATPTPAPTPDADSAEVTLAFESTPPGANVFRTGESVPLGTTPFSTTLPRAERALHIRFELEGHAPEERDVWLTESSDVVATMTVVPKPDPVAVPAGDRRPRSKRTKRPTVQREGVIDPFKNMKER